jgi:hypothetical protein
MIDLLTEPIEDDENLAPDDVMTDFNNSGCRFIPVQGTEAAILGEGTSSEGYVYFTTDTKKIFLGKGGKFIPLNGGHNFFYGNKSIPVDNSGKEQAKEETFFKHQVIESNAIPEVGDLILNTNGCFYKIKSLDAVNYYTERLTLQGSGGGGIVGPSVGGGSFSITMPNSTYAFSTETESMKISFKGYCDSKDNYISKVKCGIDGTDKIFYTLSNLRWAFGETYTHEIDLIKFKDDPEIFSALTETGLRLYVEDKYGNSRDMPFTVSLIVLKIQAENNTQNILYNFSNENFVYECVVSGGILSGGGLSDRSVIYSFFTEDEYNNKKEASYTVKHMTG